MRGGIRAFGCALVLTNLVIGTGLAIIHPEMPRIQLVSTFWPIWALLVIGMLLVFATERKGAL